MQLCDCTNVSYSLSRMTTAIPDESTSPQGDSSTHWIAYHLQNNKAMFFVLLVIFLVGILVWFSKYKLKYLFRISVAVFIFNFITLWIPTDLHIITLFITKCEESSYLYLLFCQKYSTQVLSFTMFIIMFSVRYMWALPVNIIKDSSSVGFSHLESTAKSRGRTVRELSGKMLRHREPGELNPVYVNGWLPLVESSDVVKGKVISVIAVGYKFCVYRGENGQVSVMDAYCPHMGADLSAGGKVVGNCIECPFHGWQFCGETGNCKKIPYSGKAPDVAKAKVWESCEKNGYVFVWHHVEKDPPSWEVPSIPEIENGKWVYRGRSELIVHCHIQEIPENGADIAHLPQVHSRFVFSGPQLENAGPDGHWIHHDWQPQWTPDESEPHIARVKIIQRLLLCGFEVPLTRINVDIRQIGPAIVYLHMETKFGRGVLCQHITTEGPMTQRIVHLFYTEPSFHQFPASFLIWGEAVMIERDIAVWNNKKFLKNPLLVKEDKLILKFRRWYAQFYSENSPTLKDLKQRSLDW